MVRMSTLFKVMAMVAIMFGVSYNADAQILGKIAKAVKGGNNNSSSSNSDAAKLYGPNNNVNTKPRANMSMPKADAKAAVSTFSVGKNGEIAVCTWNPATLEITMLTEMSGNQKGDVIKLDPTTGKFTNNRGEDKGSISEDGTIVSTQLGNLKLVEKNAGVFGWEYNVKGNGRELGNLNAEGFCAGDIVGPYTGNPSRLLAAYVYYGLLLDKRMFTIKEYGYDPELKFTTEQLEDKIEWKNAAAEGEIMEYESSRPYAGYNREEHPEMKNCKVAAVGLTSEWKEKKYTATMGTSYDGTTWVKTINYWVVYELTDGRNIVVFNYLSNKWGRESGTERGHGHWHEVTDWVRK